MILSRDQIIRILNTWLKNYITCGSRDQLEIFNSPRGGLVLAKRLYLVLRHPKYAHVVHGDSIDITELFRLGEELMSKHEKVFIVGLNHWFTKTDLKHLRQTFEECMD
jgi:hypothetical protein